MIRELLSVNTGKIEPIGTRRSKSGIFKRPRHEPVAISKNGLEGDSIADKANHGGPDQAVYIYTQPDYNFWAAELGAPCEPGLFGENLTVSGLESASAKVGDRYRIGKVLLEVTSPRIPCSTFAKRMNDPQWVKRFYAAGRPGIYCRVLETGAVSVRNQLELEPYRGETVSMRELFDNYPYQDISDEDRARYLSVPVHHKLAAFLCGEAQKP